MDSPGTLEVTMDNHHGKNDAGDSGSRVSPIGLLSRDEREEICPVRDLVSRIGDKWTVLVIVSLAQAPTGRSRFSELKRHVEGISQRMLTTTLRNLERDGLVNRYFYPEIPPRVEYALTPVGESVLDLMQAFIDWIQTHWKDIQTARERYDASKTRTHEGEKASDPDGRMKGDRP